MRVSRGSDVGGSGWPLVKSNWVRKLSKLDRVGLARVVVWWGKFGLEWNKVKSNQIKSALGWTWAGTNWLS